MTQDTSKEAQPDPTAPEARKPSAALLNYNAIRRKGASLKEPEYFWRDRAAWLETQGYKLRPRYQPGWEPDIPVFGPTLGDENLVPMDRMAIVDAIRIKDGRRMLLKRVYQSKHPYELEISQLFSTVPLANDPHNHCVPLEDILDPPDDPDLKIMVFPFLQRLTAIPFDTFGEIVDFIRQILIGVQFMHSHRVAHRDIGEPNIMMEGNELFPDGWNQQIPFLTPEGREHTNFFTRTQRPPKYYIIDFGLSRRYDPSDTNPLEDQIYGGDRTVPEFKSDKDAFNPFQTDIYYIGNMIRMYIMEGARRRFTGYFGTGFLQPLVKDMVQADPEKRPTIDEAVVRFDKICKKLSTWKLRSRPIPRKGNVIKGFHNHIEHWKRRREFAKQGVPPIPSRQPSKPVSSDS